jgi:molybdopterin molybdotransferase
VPGPIAIVDALDDVLARSRPLAGESVPAAAAAGRVLAEPARAAVDLPPFDSSAMDGFAVRAADTPGVLRVVGDSAAGSPFEGAVGEGEAAGISTGAEVPRGADAVVPVELVRDEGERIHADEVAAGAHVRRRGGDVSQGGLVVDAGVRLGAPEVGALAAAGLREVVCARRPRVAVLATGSELRAPGEPLAPGEIYESNSVLLAAQLESAGAVCEVLPRVSDDPAETRAGLARGLEYDVLVTSGGVSVGPHDLVRGLLAELGVDEVFWQVAVRPGKPVAFGVRGSTLVFGLPGNPVSSLVGFELFVRPALDALQGLADPRPRYLPGRLAVPVRPNTRRDELMRARVRIDRDGVALEPLTGQESHMIVRSATADALVLIVRGEAELPTGTPVSYLPI